jgi:two-component system, cell cycle response regulator DivK
VTPPRPLILIVDDSEKNRKLARDVLRAAGLEALEAASGTDALAVASERLPDLILLDLQLPDIDGAEVARELQDCARTAQITIVAFSASPYLDSGDRLLQAGFAGYLRKPIDVREFPEQVRRFCARDDA